jgi:protein-disulfide isomerase
MLSNNFNKALAGSAPSGDSGSGSGTGAVVDVKEGDSPSIGDKNAPVTIIEFSDFECPFCERFYTQSYKQIKANYVDTGKVRIVFKHFPLPFHANAQKAAEASECAREQGKFWEMHDKLFENQNAISISSLKGYAADLGLDTSKFNSCLDSGKYASRVQKDASDGSAAGVSGTPSFFINGKSVVGAQPYSVFQQAIEAELNA